MEESVTYQAVVAKGRVAEARKILLRVGRRHLGEPDSAVLAAVNALEDIEQLERLVERVHDAETWSELLAKFARRRRNGPR